MFREAPAGKFQENAFKTAACYLTEEVSKRWIELLGTDAERKEDPGTDGNGPDAATSCAGDLTNPIIDREPPAADFVLLLDNTGRESVDLHASFKSIGASFFSCVINDDGFAPDGIESVYGYFLGYPEGKEHPGKPRYFNRIEVPGYWEISGTGRGGRITDMSHERARIFYAEPAHKRYVKIVDWIDGSGIVRSSDHYNKNGCLFARTAFNSKGERVNRSYFSKDGNEIIVENFVTKDIILNFDRQVRMFKNKTELVIFYLEKRKLDDKRIFYNSLSYPFFVSEDLKGRGRGDILFWQEEIKDDIPGNMQIILGGRSACTESIAVQKRRAYDKMAALKADMGMVRLLGFVYPFARPNRYTREILICTNSDNIACLSEITERLSSFRFHIAALTEMSSKLMAYGDRKNVILYPGVSMGKLDELFDRCDLYLDINHENEIVSAVRRAFLNNMLILAFRETLHDGVYVEDSHIFSEAEPEGLIAFAGALAGNGRAGGEYMETGLMDKELVDRELARQREHALCAEEDMYRQII
ncbi:MAG: accessory Sec system glycosylation chaperone GtfB [Lachnospiraceae bacterium]|nr:accessory Sec system glycosylation chaperone GtfB [Lachnospiraceae bacterium]